jgi:ParB/RepB/Spo0J family partition protein
MHENISQIDINKLQPHPQNPRLSLRQDVVDALIINIGKNFDPAHALLVRETASGYEVLSGHHRLEAAKRNGLESVPCWVRDMNDDEAYMALVTSNSQGELSPLEIGFHALNCVALSAGGRGQKGGLSAYAERVGKSQPFISQLVKAAEVAKGISGLMGLETKTQHLNAIHSLPESCWPEAVQFMLDKGWSKEETQKRVKDSEASTEKRRIALFVGKTSQRELKRMDDLRQQVAQNIEYEDLKAEWLDWLNVNDPTDIKEFQAQRIEIEERVLERREAEEEAAKAQREITLPQLVLADPPWRYDFAQSDSRQIENQYPSATVDEIIDHSPETHHDCVLFMWATVAKLQEAFEVMQGWGFEYKTHAVWDKQKIGMGYWFRGQHELLLVGTKGQASPPEEANRVSSVFSEGRGKHSKKPECVYQWLDTAFPNINKLEMYCRESRQGWVVFGNESGVA